MYVHMKNMYVDMKIFPYVLLDIPMTINVLLMFKYHHKAYIFTHVCHIATKV